MLLEQIHDPSDVRKLNDEQARLLCRELRTFLLEQVSRTGGHLASNLGVVELTVAIHRVFDTSQDPHLHRRDGADLRYHHRRQGAGKDGGHQRVYRRGVPGGPAHAYPASLPMKWSDQLAVGTDT